MDNNHSLDIALEAALRGNQDLSEEILKSCEDQDDARVIFNLGWHDMRHGNISSGLKKMDAGRFISCFGSPRINGEIWRDQPLENKTLLLRGEGGFGDQIINFRFAYDFKNKGANVVVSCDPSLSSLFSKHGFICVNNQACESVYYDYWVPAMSAPHILNYEAHNFPNKPYLHSEPIDLYSEPGNLKVGIRWAGSPRFEHEQYRKFDPKPLIDLHKIPGITLYSLQRDENTIEGLPFSDLRSQMKDWDSTASIIAGLDLLITSCTSVAHCAAALGIPTWVIVPILPYYTWAIPGETSPWYESVRLFRQTEFGNWDVPMQQVREELQKLVAFKDAA